MNSFNHYSLGSVLSWLYENTLGIQRDEEQPGYKHFTLKPEMGTFEFAEGGIDTPYGRIESAWKKTEEGYFCVGTEDFCNIHRGVYFVISYLLICFGIALSNRCGLPIIPTDLFPRELADITKIKYSRIKIGFDVTCLAITALMTCIILGHLDGLGIGTILAAFTMGKVIGMIGDQMDRHVRFESFMTKRSA